MKKQQQGMFVWLAAIALVMAVAVGRAEAQPVAEPLLRALFPDATHFGPPDGTPPAVPAYGDGRLLGFVLSTRQVIGSVGFSGKPFDIVIGLDMAGRLTGVKIADHHEPILEIGVGEADLDTFVAGYTGRDIRDPLQVLRNSNGESGPVDGVSGATISSIVFNDAILRASRIVARSRGIIESVGTAATVDLDGFAAADWPALMAEGSVRHRVVTVGDAVAAMQSRGGALFSSGVTPSNLVAAYYDLYWGLASAARIGRNLFGDQTFNRITAERHAGDQMIFVAANGLYSFKGHRYRRSGWFDRIQLVQGARTLRFRKEDHIRIDTLEVVNAPDLREMAVFVVPAEWRFDPGAPWRIDLLVTGESPDGTATIVTFSHSYELPQRYRIAESPVPVMAQDRPLWQQIWLARVVEVAVVVALSATLIAIVFFQDWLVRHRRLFFWGRITFLAFTLVWLGWYAGAQLSVLNVLTFSESVLTVFHWDFFLLDPLIFVLWSFVAVGMLFWGRGIFCGWLCPFGALQELLSHVAKWVRIPQLHVPFTLHERLWPIKYIAFLILFALSLGGLGLAQAGIEIEPFKTVIVLAFDRGWPFLAYAGALLGVGLFIERFFCRYICPLGGSLAIPARMRMFEWLHRRWQCGIQCHICEQRCPVQAIHPEGHINPNECIYCLGCQVLYHDETTCPPLVERVRRKESRMTNRLIDRMAEAENKGEGQTGGTNA